LKILVVAPSWIGDTVAAQPLFMRLHERHQHSLTLDVIAPPWVAPVLRRMPEVARVLEHPFSHGGFGFGARRNLGLRLRGARYDEAIVLPNSWKSALVPFFAGIPKRTGYTGEARYGLLNNRHTLDKAALPQIVQRYAALADPPGKVFPGTFPAPRLGSNPAQLQAVLAELQLDQDRAPIVFCPGAEYGPAKRWPAAYYAQLARNLRERGHSVWLIGSAKDAVVGEEIVAASAGACRNLCGRTGLEQAVDLLAAAQCVVTNDSGLMHVAAALDRPLVAVFGSSSPRFTPPLSYRAEVLWLEIECSPCFRRECPKGHFRCMVDIRPGQVLERIEGRLAAEARRV
jgi:heptosyltransferase II